MTNSTLTLNISLDHKDLERLESIVERIERSMQIFDDSIIQKVEVVNVVQTTEAYPGQ